ncbi:3-oxoacyl-ACP synthase [Alkaliphilus peptidifermentans]|uniref:3-oxoacyl-[acyl-carrier-protein] synthase-3 n=1 Tax=Alkaliphilus peptidifermentans DSM 18978 TaxID=1120976 RepID=A0A1G5ABW0_9FIRM|nr:3-oxoacyl-ACP synthase [Alkaliphilus peptidifermentans]SCX75348.1 3-oxoacyl-[acyl-carrier-protein] synthase-3 [Alkaliphilus peptidifermentans DSM 18978]
MKDIHVGIVGMGLYIPETYETAEEIAQQSGIPVDVIKNKFGFNKKPIPGVDDGTMEMGVRAAQDCLNKTNTNPLDIDVIISIGEEHKEYPLTTTGIYIQEAIGAYNAWAFDVAQRCGTAVVAMKLAKSLMMSDPSINTILIAGGYRNGDFIDYKNDRVTFMFNLAAGGGAILLKKNYGKNLLLESRIITDGSFARDVAVKYGGTINPLTKENIEYGLKSLDVLDPQHMKNGLGEKSMPNFLKAIDDSLSASGFSRKDIDYVAMLHMKPSAHEYVMNELGLGLDKSIYLRDYGHIGQIDQILSTSLALNEEKIKDGSIVVWVSAGIGYAWDACTIKWGNS